MPIPVMKKKYIMTCFKLSEELSDRLTEASTILRITGQTKTGIIQLSLVKYLDRLEQDQSYQDLKKRAEKIKRIEFEDY